MSDKLLYWSVRQVSINSCTIYLFDIPMVLLYLFDMPMVWLYIC